MCTSSVWVYYSTIVAVWWLWLVNVHSTHTCIVAPSYTHYIECGFCCKRSVSCRVVIFDYLCCYCCCCSRSYLLSLSMEWFDYNNNNGHTFEVQVDHVFVFVLNEMNDCDRHDSVWVRVCVCVNVLECDSGDLNRRKKMIFISVFVTFE